jgi:hypothetical protein
MANYTRLIMTLAARELPMHRCVGGPGETEQMMVAIVVFNGMMNAAMEPETRL